MIEKFTTLLEDIPRTTIDAVDSFLDSDKERLEWLMSAADPVELRDRRDKIQKEAEKVLANFPHAERAFTDQLVRRWIKLHPTEKKRPE